MYVLKSKVSKKEEKIVGFMMDKQKKNAKAKYELCLRKCVIKYCLMPIHPWSINITKINHYNKKNK